MTSHLFILTIGPVQSFIAQARKTHDLFAGSVLLSALCAVGIKEAIQHFGSEQAIITPTLHEKADGSLDTRFLPNRFVAKVPPGKSTEDLKDIGTQIETAIRSYFLEEADQSMQKAGITNKEAYKAQIDHHLNVEWLFVPINDDGYQAAYTRLFKELSALKTTSQFVQLSEVGRKCNVDGERNVVLYRKQPKEVANLKRKLFLDENQGEVTVVDFNEEQQLPVWELKAGEGISAVSHIKRQFANQPHKFPSTIKVALLDLLYKVKDWEEFNSLKDRVEGGNKFFPHSNDQLYIKENIDPLVDTYGSGDPAIKNELKQLHKALTTRMDNELVPKRFTRYYSLIMFDGDNLGQWLRGKYLKNDDLDLETFHRDFTECLRTFAEAVDSKYTYDSSIPSPYGKMVYAGGEDFMVFLNIHHLFTELKWLRDTFDTLVNQELQKPHQRAKYQFKEGQQLTISLGATIAHYKTPLNLVIEKSRELEALAKKSGRDSFAIGVLKHSGSRVDTVYPWHTTSPGIQSLTLMDDISAYITSGAFSSAFITNICQALFDLGYDLNDDLTYSKIKLYVARAANEEGKESVQELIDKLITLQQIKSVDSTGQKLSNENFTEALKVIDFINRKSSKGE